MLNTYWDNIKNDNLLAGQEQLDAELIYDTKFLYSKKSFPQRRSRLRLRYGFGKHFFPFFKISNELSVLADLRTDGVPKAQIRDIECEATQPIEKAEQEKQEAGLTYVTNLFPYFPVLDLLHAHGDSPEERCSSRLVPFAIRTRFAVLLAGVKRVCNAAAFASPFRPLPARAPSVRKSAIPLFPCKRAAFTLAEVLITLAVIGIVAALTLPGLIQNHNEKAWSTAKDLWEKKLIETVRRMNVDGVMTGHDTTEDFMNTFKNYMKVIKTCDNSDINKCYSPKVVTTGKDDAPLDIETETLTSASSMGLKEWQTNTNTMSFVVADGTTVIMAYQPECPYADPIEDTGSQVSCMAYMVDVNGKKGPNRVGKDIQLSSGVAFSTCDNPIGDMCWSTDFQPTALDTTLDENKQYDENYAATNNYWAGAKKACKDKGMELPTRAQLAQLASNLYVDSAGNAVTIGASESKFNLKLKDEYSQNPPISIGYYYWSSEESDTLGACARGFYTSVCYWHDGSYTKGDSGRRAICVSN